MDIKYFPSTREYTQLYGINQEILDNLGKKIVIMHPGPINRGVEITSDVVTDWYLSLNLNKCDFYQVPINLFFAQLSLYIPVV